MRACTFLSTGRERVVDQLREFFVCLHNWKAQFFSLVITTLFLTSISGCGQKIPDTVRIGVPVTLSGPNASRGQDLLNGALLAAEEINKAGFMIGNKPIKFEIIAKDDKADPAIIKQVAQELVDSQVQAVIGHVNSQQTKVALPIYASKNIPHLFTSSNKNLITPTSNNAFRLVANDEVQARAIASYSTQILHAEKIVAAVEDSDYGHELFNDVADALKEYKQGVILKYVVDGKQPVSDEFIEKMKNLDCDLVLVLGREIHVLSLLEKLKKNSYTKPTLLLSNGAKTEKVSQAEITARSVLATTSTLESEELLGGKEFLARFKEKYKSKPVWGAHYAYEAVNVLADAMRRANSLESSDIIKKLKTADLNSKVIQMQFAPNGEQKYPSIGVYEVRGKKWGPLTRASNW